MPATKFKELHARTEADLKRELATLQEKMREIKFKINAGEQKNFKELGHIKKTIARIQTSLTQRTR